MNPQQFQPELPGMQNLRTRLPVLESHGEKSSPDPYEKHNDAAEIWHERGGSSLDMMENPLFSDRANAAYHDMVDNRRMTGDAEFEWYPTEKIESPQTRVIRPALQSQIENSRGLEVPDVMMYRDRQDGDFLMNGNHRALSAQFRGQLFIPAKVREVQR